MKKKPKSTSDTDAHSPIICSSLLPEARERDRAFHSSGRIRAKSVMSLVFVEAAGVSHELDTRAVAQDDCVSEVYF